MNGTSAAVDTTTKAKISSNANRREVLQSLLNVKDSDAVSRMNSNNLLDGNFQVHQVSKTIIEPHRDAYNTNFRVSGTQVATNDEKLQSLGSITLSM